MVYSKKVFDLPPVFTSAKVGNKIHIAKYFSKNQSIQQTDIQRSRLLQLIHPDKFVGRM